MESSIRIAQVRLLLRPTVRTIRWVPLAVIAPLGFAILYAGLHDDGPGAEVPLPLTGLLLAVWMGFLLDDKAAETTRNLPTPLLLRRALRIAVALPAVGAIWGLWAWYAGLDWKTGPLTAALAGQLAAALALAAVGTRVAGEDRAGLFTAGGLFVIFFALPLIFHVSLSLDSPEASWGHLYGRWISMSLISMVVFLIANVDPARRSPVGSLKLRIARPAVAMERVAP